MNVTRFAALAAAASLCAASAANAELIYGLTAASTGLVTFDSATPGTVSATTPITGVTTGLLRGIDFRPSNGLLYGYSYNPTGTVGQLYTINTTSGAATAVGAPLTLTSIGASSRVSIDFNPVADALRVVSGSGANYRVNADTGALLGQDTILAYAATDPNAATTPIVGDVAYTNSVAGATSTTLYSYEFALDNITTVGGINSTPSPNGGQLFTVGTILPVSGGDAGNGLDISGTTGIAYLSLDDIASPTLNDELYRVNLSTGALTLLGTAGVDLLDISVAPVAVPEPASLAVLGGAALLGLARRRRA